MTETDVELYDLQTVYQKLTEGGQILRTHRHDPAQITQFMDRVADRGVSLTENASRSALMAAVVSVDSVATGLSNLLALNLISFTVTIIDEQDETVGLFRNSGQGFTAFGGIVPANIAFRVATSGPDLASNSLQSAKALASASPTTTVAGDVFRLNVGNSVHYVANVPV